MRHSAPGDRQGRSGTCGLWEPCTCRAPLASQTHTAPCPSKTKSKAWLPIDLQISGNRAHHSCRNLGGFRALGPELFELFFICCTPRLLGCATFMIGLPLRLVHLRFDGVEAARHVVLGVGLHLRSMRSGIVANHCVHASDPGLSFHRSRPDFPAAMSEANLNLSLASFSPLAFSSARAMRCHALGYSFKFQCGVHTIAK